MILIIFWGKRQKSCTKFHHVVSSTGLRCGEWHKRWLKWLQSRMSGQKAPGGWGGTLHGLDITLRSPRKWPSTPVPNPGQPIPSCPQRAAFILPHPERPQKVWSGRGAQKEEGIWFPLWGLIAILLTWVYYFIKGRGLQNGFGEICSTLFTLKFWNISETISSDSLRKFRDDDLLVWGKPWPGLFWKSPQGLQPKLGTIDLKWKIRHHWGGHCSHHHFPHWLLHWPPTSTSILFSWEERKIFLPYIQVQVIRKYVILLNSTLRKPEFSLEIPNPTLGLIWGDHTP